MPEQFYSEDGVDKWLAESGLLPETGFYVDAGCAHPFRYSQTAFLRARGWSGLAVDADPAYAPEWEGIPNVQFANLLLSDKPAERFLVEPTNALVSRCHELGKLTPAFTLQQVLEISGVGKVDFMSLDIEGMEAPILHDFLVVTWPKQAPKILVVEYNSCHKGRDVRVFNEMANTLYRMIHMTDSNAVYQRIP